MNDCGIYLIENPLGHVYVGCSKRLSKRIPLYKAMRSNRPIDLSIKEHGFEKHVFTIIEYCDPNHRLRMYELEQFYTQYFEFLGLTVLNVFNTRKVIGNAHHKNKKHITTKTK